LFGSKQFSKKFQEELSFWSASMNGFKDLRETRKNKGNFYNYKALSVEITAFDENLFI